MTIEQANQLQTIYNKMNFDKQHYVCGIFATNTTNTMVSFNIENITIFKFNLLTKSPDGNQYSDDKLLVYDGLNNSGTLIGTYTGDNTEIDLSDLVSSCMSNYITLNPQAKSHGSTRCNITNIEIF